MNTTQNHTARLAYSAGNSWSDSKSYNRYAYVMNNPMKFTDPSGYVSDGPTLGKIYDPMYGLHYRGQMARITEMGYMKDHFKELDAFWAFMDFRTQAGYGSSPSLSLASSTGSEGGSVIQSETNLNAWKDIPIGTYKLVESVLKIRYNLNDGYRIRSSAFISGLISYKRMEF